MPLWDVNLPPWPSGNFSTIKLVEVLVAYDGPITFTFEDAVGTFMLAHLCDDDGEVARYVVAPTTRAAVLRLKNGAASVRAVLDQPLVWLLDLSDGQPVRAWATSPGEIPSGVLPAREVMLRPSLQPLIRTRAVGAAIKIGAIPADAIRTLVAGVEGAIATLFDFVLGQTSREIRYGYDLNATQLTLASIEVAFEARKAGDNSLLPPERDPIIARVESLLARGLAWSQAGGELVADSAEEEIAIMEALRVLAPKRGGDAERVEITGRVASAARKPKVMLTNVTRQLAAERLKTLRQYDPQPITIILHGRVGEIDYDRNTALYRNFRVVEPSDTAKLTVVHGDEVKLVFTPEQLDSVVEVADIKSRMVGEAQANATSIQLDTIRPLREHESPDEL